MAARHPLPYAFAKANSLLLETDGDLTTLWTSSAVPLSALSEVMRLFVVTRSRASRSRRLPSASPRATPGGEAGGEGGGGGGDT